ncbi:hypothetical protein ACWFMI_23435 [Nocardiopsis terrae]|uniref:hypothetical protein n=1 Tax=Streptomyces sp. NPDC057554 TaxID=3350538 RepID=UPI003687D833
MAAFHFEFVLQSGAVIHSGVEEFPTAQEASEWSKAWMEERAKPASRERIEGMTIATETYEGGAVSIRCAEIEHTTVLTPAQVARQAESFFPSTVAPAHTQEAADEHP